MFVLIQSLEIKISMTFGLHFDNIWRLLNLRLMSHLPQVWRDIFYSILFYPITLEGRRDTTDEFATIPFHLVLFSAALVDLTKSFPVQSLILSSHIFFCLPLFLCPFTVPCRTVLLKTRKIGRTILVSVS